MDKYELVERYEALGEESDFPAAKRLFEEEFPGQPDAFFRQYGYLLECHGRREIRRALRQYERSIALDPEAEKTRYQWLSVKATLHESDDAIAACKKRVAESPGNARELRLWTTYATLGTPVSVPAAFDSGTPTGGPAHVVAEHLAFFTGLGVAIVFIAALALGRMAVAGALRQGWPPPAPRRGSLNRP